jgi:O-antigen/teichoic acid export membrane protein
MLPLRFGLSLAEQGFGSMLTFAVNLWLIRNGAASQYGTYVFWMSVAFVTGVAQGTLVLAHLSRLPSAKDQPDARRDPERFMLTVSLALFVILTACVGLGDYVLARTGSELATPAAVVYVLGFLLFQYARTYAFSRQQPALAASLTGGILLVAVLSLGIDFELGHKPDAARVLLLNGLAFSSVSVIVLLRLLGGMGPMWRWPELVRQKGAIRGSAWLMLGAGSNEVTGRLYSFVIVGRFGTEALAAMSAVQVVIRPAWLLSSAWSSIGFPDMAGRWARGDRHGVLRTMAFGAAITGLGSLVWSCIVVEAWPWIAAVIYHGRYTEVGPLTYLWGSNVVVGCFCVALNTAMLAVGEFRRLALIDLAGAVVTVAALGVVIPLFSYPYAIAATILGQAMQLALMGLVVRHRLRPQAVPSAAPQPG